MRPGRPEDLAGYLALARAAAAAGEIDAVPSGPWLERLLEGFDWDTRSRVVEEGGRIAAMVLVFERRVVGGTLTRLECSGDASARARLLEWGLLYSRACGALAAQVWRGRGHGAGLRELGLAPARHYQRMDRRGLDRLPEAALPDGYRWVTEDADLPDHAWVEAYNTSFAEHWRFSPKPDGAVAWRRAREANGPELMALTRSGRPAAVVTCSIERFDDARAQPVGIVATVGTLPEHRRRGLAFALVVEALRRLRERGARSASLYVDAYNPTRAYDLYARAGFEVGFELEVWEAGFI